MATKSIKDIQRKRKDEISKQDDYNTVLPETFAGENFREFRCIASFCKSFIRQFLLGVNLKCV